jgi:uncharacterized membrane protein YdjX (TVP38/TMEM64 family)
MAGNNNKKSVKALIGYGVLLLSICLLLYFYKEAYLWLRDTVRFFSSKNKVAALVASFGPCAPVVFVGLQTLQVLFAPIPGELTGFIGGYIFGTGLGFVYSTLGLTGGSLLAFLIARRLGLPFVRRFVGEELMGKFDYLMEHKGAFFSLIFFFIPGLPKDYFCYLLGLSPMHVLTFFIISTIGRIPGTLLLSMQGQAVRSEDYRGFFVVIGIALFALALTIIYRDRIEIWLKHKKGVGNKGPLPPG